MAFRCATSWDCSTLRVDYETTSMSTDCFREDLLTVWVELKALPPRKNARTSTWMRLSETSQEAWRTASKPCWIERYSVQLALC
eukprot:5150215-Amphidinium_carterae.1